MKGPDPKESFPIQQHKRVCFIKNIVKNPNIIIGDYTYYDDPESPENFEKNVLYHYDFIGDKLIIGKFCAIAMGTQFIMNGANHEMLPFSTYPFGIFGKGWEKILEGVDFKKKFPSKGDTIIGNDVWIGYKSIFMPGVQIGNGAIIASGSVVTRNVPDYCIVGGNPAQIIRQRFDDKTIRQLLEIAWWNWDIEKINRNLKIINSNQIKELLLCR